MPVVSYDGARAEVLPELYVPYTLETLTSKSFVVRAAPSRIAALPAALREALRRVDAQQPLREIRSMDEWVAGRTADSRSRKSGRCGTRRQSETGRWPP